MKNIYSNLNNRVCVIKPVSISPDWSLFSDLFGRMIKIIYWVTMSLAAVSVTSICSFCCWLHFCSPTGVNGSTSHDSQ